MVGRAEQKCRPQWLGGDRKRPKAVPQKATSEPTISYLEFFLENIILGIQSFYICPDVPVDIIRVFFKYQIF